MNALNGKIWLAVAMTAALTAGGVQAAPAPPKEYKTSIEQYEAMKAAARGGVKMTWAKLPDWSGLWTRDLRVMAFDETAPREPRLPFPYGKFTGVLTPQYQPTFDAFVNEVAQGREWDQLSSCLPAGFPRSLTEPFLREFVLRPETVWGIIEVQGETRRIYTDGRGHVPDDEAYPLWDGDSIGFWDGDTLVVHTNSLKAGRYTRGQPEISEQASTVERIRKLESGIIEDEIWIYDPPILAKPWRVVFKYRKVTDPPNLRLNMWSCEENSNVSKAADGSTSLLLPGDVGYRDPNNLEGGAKTK